MILNKLKLSSINKYAAENKSQDKQNTTSTNDYHSALYASKV